MKNPEISSVPVTTEHVTIRSAKPFEAVRAALEAAVPLIDNAYVQLLAAGKVDAARDLLWKQAPLSIFGTRNHGQLLQVAGLQRRAIQYDIGNPLTASEMTRHVLSSALYAPIRVLLSEDHDGRAVFEYDRPKTSFGQFGDKDVDAVAGELDGRLREALVAAST
ncbi:hypothetical protein ASG32_27605 [Methylobacterium sp. Leaf361]|uniref:DUF302 domain-containing protein n=1 Tax=Methylobacterium sp. Leaf361 TaxID=1736352 RepID=UPI0006F8152A|nr:DUF302 domain-containing protein [Methylobacterium sp. Leaf361]KQS74270.1 hypothetical protein ASG32_27605 [Methylobacterium sp. Leaf361]